MKTRYIKIDGVVTVETNITADDFLDAFLAFIESKNLYFVGFTGEVDEEGEYIPETII